MIDHWCVGYWWGDLLATIFTILFSIILGIGIGFMRWGKKRQKENRTEFGGQDV